MGASRHAAATQVTHTGGNGVSRVSQFQGRLGGYCRSLSQLYAMPPTRVATRARLRVGWRRCRSGSARNTRHASDQPAGVAAGRRGRPH
eukprot:7388945-Prymnesium_polylepis.1